MYNGSFLIILICRNFVSDIHAKTGQILNRGSAQQIGGSAGGGYDNTVAIKVHISQLSIRVIYFEIPLLSLGLREPKIEIHIYIIGNERQYS